jgi:hypothetical protein
MGDLSQHEVNNRNLIATIVGQKGSGKTVLTIKIAKYFPRVIAFDTVGQYGERDGFEVKWGRMQGARALVDMNKRLAFRISLRADEVEDLLALMEVAYDVPDTLIIVDETPWYCSPSQFPVQLSRLVRYGRHRRISQLYVAQRASEIHRSITAQSDIIVSFKQREPRDVKYLIDAGGGEDARRVEELPEYRLIAFGSGMERDDVPPPILEQMHDFHGKEPEQLDMFEPEQLDMFEQRE